MYLTGNVVRDVVRELVTLILECFWLGIFLRETVVWYIRENSL